MHVLIYDIWGGQVVYKKDMHVLWLEMTCMSYFKTCMSCVVEMTCMSVYMTSVWWK